MNQGKLSWSAPIPRGVLRHMLVGASAGLLSIVMFAGVAVMLVTG